MRRVLLVLGAAVTSVLLSASPALAQEPTLTVTINSAVIINPFQMRVAGTIDKCVAGEQYGAFVVVTQKGPKQSTVRGFGSTGGTCANTGPQTWTEIVGAEDLTFNPGKTFVSAEGQVCDETGEPICSVGSASRTLQVKRG